MYNRQDLANTMSYPQGYPQPQQPPQMMQQQPQQLQVPAAQQGGQADPFKPIYNAMMQRAMKQGQGGSGSPMPSTGVDIGFNPQAQDMRFNAWPTR